MSASEDPGWRPALRPTWQLLVPWVALLSRKRRLDLVGLRRMVLHVGITLGEAAIVISSTLEGSTRDATWAWVILGLGTAGAVGGLIWTKKAGQGAPPESAESVANGSRALTLIRLGFAASPALYGIVGAELAGAAEFGFAGVVVSLVLFAIYGPTRSRIEEIEERLRVSGSRISVRAALDEAAS